MKELSNLTRADYFFGSILISIIALIAANSIFKSQLERGRFGLYLAPEQIVSCIESVRELALHGEYPLYNEIDIFALSNLKLAYSDIDNPEDLWATGIVYIEGSPATLRSTFPCARSVTSRGWPMCLDESQETRTQYWPITKRLEWLDRVGSRAMFEYSDYTSAGLQFQFGCRYLTRDSIRNNQIIAIDAHRHGATRLQNFASELPPVGQTLFRRASGRNEWIRLNAS